MYPLLIWICLIGNILCSGTEVATAYFHQLNRIVGKDLGLFKSLVEFSLEKQEGDSVIRESLEKIIEELADVEPSEIESEIVLENAYRFLQWQISEVSASVRNEWLCEREIDQGASFSDFLLKSDIIKSPEWSASDYIRHAVVQTLLVEEKASSH